MTATDAQKVAAIATVVLYGKYWLTTILQGTKKEPAGLGPTEDGGNSFSSVAVATSAGAPADKAMETALRWQRIVANDVENIPIALVVMWACANTVTVDETVPFIIYCCLYVVARIAHTICYANGINKLGGAFPLRTVCFAIGFLMVHIMAITTVVVMFK